MEEDRRSEARERALDLLYEADAKDQSISEVLTARMFGTTFDDALLDDLDLVKLQYATVRSLSKGEAKRLDIAIGLAVPRTVLLLDEPFDGLDLRQTRQVMEILRRDAAKGRTLVLSIHQLSDAARTCDRFLLLDHGRSVAEGTLEELTNGTGGLEEAFLLLLHNRRKGRGLGPRRERIRSTCKH